ncbi:hypothetical protein DelCs14_2854 [Delftia sp. Cs1-4]|uniref:hypothetical protein n=1 Tax=Delftia sp. (strain Cs1-4) TaxID=742013 RepID=UPI00020E84E3|nr:hypothetical protein [Delftia sp. Cs1-4]AEF89866.1 hypothetical protein DelCs14_2854 [Delftia sp. Cs1-4]
MNLENLEQHELEEFQKQIDDKKNPHFLFLMALKIIEEPENLDDYFEVYEHHFIIKAFDENKDYLKSLDLENVNANTFNSIINLDIETEKIGRRKKSIENKLEIKHDKLEKKIKI